MGRKWEGGSGWGTHVNPWLIHVNVWQKPLQYCKVISLQLIKINGKKKTKKKPHNINSIVTNLIKTLKMVQIKKKKKKRERLKEKNDTIQIEFCVNACDGHQSFS